MAEEHDGAVTSWSSVPSAAEALMLAWADGLRKARPGHAASHSARPSIRVSRSTDLLDGVRQDTDGVEFTRRLLDLVVGSEDAFVSAVGLREVSRELPESMPARDRFAVRAGGIASLGLPWAVLPVARRLLRERVSHLVLAESMPADAKKLGSLSGLHEVMRGHHAAGLQTSLLLQGDAVHGPARAQIEVERLTALTGVLGLQHLAIDPERLVPDGSEWSFEADVEAAVQALRPILETAREHDTAVTLEPQSVRWALRAPEVLIRALSDPELNSVRAGVRAFAELPESRELVERVLRWARSRIDEGGEPVEVVIGVARALGSERIASIESGLAVPVVEGRTETSAGLLRLTELVVRGARSTGAVRPVVACEDPHLLAAAVSIAERHGVAGSLAVRLRSGVATQLAGVLARQLSDVRVQLPLTPAKEFGGAIDTIVRLAAEAVDPEAPLAHLDELLRELSAEPAEEEAAPAAPVEPAGADSAIVEDTDSGAAAQPGDEESVSAGHDGEPGGEETPEESATLAVERARFRAAVAAAAEGFPASHRTQLRAREWDPSERDSALFYRPPDEAPRFDTGGLTAAVLGLSRGSSGELGLEVVGKPVSIPAVSSSGFAGEPDTDASLAANREWARALLHRAAARAAAEDEADATVALSPDGLQPADATAKALTAGERWAAGLPATRAVRLRRLALGTVAARDRLIEVIAVDSGRPISEIDAEIGDIVDAARYCAGLAESLGAVRGATFVPIPLALVAADAYTPLSAQAETVLAGLAAGSAVLWAVPAELLRSAEVLVEEWEAAGLPVDLVHIISTAADGLLETFVSDPDINRVMVLGSRDEARAAAHRRPDLRVDGRFQTTGAMLITPSTDIDAAVNDLVRSAFRGAGADPRAVHAAILLGSVGRSKRFRGRLADAVRALRAGDTARPGSADPLGFTIGPLPAPPDEAGLRALTRLGRGEEWLVEPQRLDDAGRLWSPGVRLGVSADASFWADARRVPVLGLVHAHSLSDAISLQHRVGGGAVSGIHSLDPAEILPWLDRAAAASLVVNRPTTRARIERLPSGGWDDAVMGLPALAGGPNQLIPLGSWESREGTRSGTLHLRGLDPEVQLLIEMAQASLVYEEFDGVRRGALADALAWRTSLGVVRDTIGLGVERNVLRHWPVATQLRLAEGGAVAELLRVLAAALLVRAPVAVSTGEVLPTAVTTFLAHQGIEVSLERDDDWLERIAATGPTAADGKPAARVRLIGGDRVRVAEWMGGLDRASLWAEPVTMAGPVELLALLREQSLSIRAHRHGMASPVPGIDEWLDSFER